MTHFNAPLIVRAKIIIRQCSQTATFKARKTEAESNPGLSAYQFNALPLGNCSQFSG